MEHESQIKRSSLTLEGTSVFCDGIQLLDLVYRTISLRPVRETDAEFILTLRMDERYNLHLSKVDNDLASQRQFIKRYMEEEKANNEFYFIIQNLDGTPCGTVRIYDLQDDSFCWGSWILNEDKTRFAAVESALLVYRFGFDALNYASAHFDVRRNNTTVISFHQKFGAIEIHEDDTDLFFSISSEAVKETEVRFLNRLSVKENIG